MSNIIYTSDKEAKKLREDLQQYGAFPVEKLFDAQEWFAFTSLTPKLRAFALVNKLETHPDIVISDILRTEKTKDVYELLLSNKSGAPIGCIDVNKLLNLSRERPQIIREEAVAMQNIKMQKDLMVNSEREKVLHADKVDVPEVSTQTKTVSSYIPQDTLSDIRLNNINLIYPIGCKSIEELAAFKESLKVVYPEAIAQMQKVLDTPVASREYSSLAPYLQSTSELSSFWLASIANDSTGFDHFKKHYTQWSLPDKPSQTLLPAILLDPTTSNSLLREVLPMVELSDVSAAKFYSSPNAFLYGLNLTARIVDKRPLYDVDKTFYNNVRTSLGVSSSTAIDFLNSIKDHPTHSLHNSYYDILKQSGVLTKDNTISDRVIRHVTKGEVAWIESEHSYIIDRLTLPEPKISTEGLDKLSLGL